MNNTVNQRIEILVNKYAEGNKAKFAKSIGVTPTSFSNYVGERQSKPGYDVLNSILKNYPKINSEWLILGIGNIEKNLDKKNVEYDELQKEHFELMKKYTSLLENNYSAFLMNLNANKVGKLKATNGKDLEVMPMSA